VHLRLRRSVEDAMRHRLTGDALPGASALNGELFPQELDAAIDQALSKLGKAPPTGSAGG
jgi:hypothetical protein